MHRISLEWIANNKTKNGGYKRVQLQAIGVSWPPKQGWPRRVAGKEISLEQKQFFESFKSTPSLPKIVDTCLCNVLPWEDCEHTMSLFAEL